MKQVIKKIIFKILEIEARLVLLRYRPKIIAVTGTVGKTATKDAIYTALSSQFHVRKNKKSLNSEIGVPLTILGLETGWNNPIIWFRNIFLGALQIIYRPHYPKWLVLETGVDHPGDMKKTASWLRPNVAVFTAFAKVPSHVENFDSPEHVMQEKSKLMDYLRDDGVVILNADDENVLKLKKRSKHKVYTFGQNQGSDLIATNQSIIYENNIPTGMSFKIEYEGNTVPVNLNNIIGDQFAYPILAAMTVGVSLGLSVVPMATALSGEMKIAPGRMNLIKGKNDSVIIDDSYNASPIAMNKAVQVLGQVQATGKKVAVLGDMLEIGHFSANEHRKIGSLVVNNKIDYLITVGLHSELIAEQAREDGMFSATIFSYKNSDSSELSEKISEFLEPGNIILVKGSQGIRTEKIVKQIMNEPDRANELLARQEKEWQNR
jgi:UDP-N-acetylmuramoyl-tripeptide--D-alanyl-D-alanine ligase